MSYSSCGSRRRQLSLRASFLDGSIAVGPRWLVLPLIALVLGFALGGSVFWAAFGPNATLDQANAAYELKSTGDDPGEKKPNHDPLTV
jgi:hypothetical protein